MKKFSFCFLIVIATYLNNASAQITDAGNGLYKPNSTTLSLSNGSSATNSAVILDFGTSSLGSFLIKKGTNDYLNINNAGDITVGSNNYFGSFNILSQTQFYRLAYFNSGGNYLGNGSVLSQNEGGMYADGDVTVAIYDFDAQVSRYGHNGLLGITPNSMLVGHYNSTGPNGTLLDVNGNIFCNKKIFIGTADANTTTRIAPYALAVNGDAIFNKVKVKLYGTWPDYVFEKDYHLPTLEEIEFFIKKNKHLPDVPSEKEVMENGIDLGETQSILLKKIEELTLHLINMNKNINELKKENELLKLKLTPNK